ncbi:microtubule-actin cross-linking factor 1 isoform X43 [Tribolium castaneum]|uniref:microtubule-actin cross-linking factor 1 isoform X43 n=1 Tax=Tribolium castaneum TaxID=7070 RepID=UPI00077D9565|nr:PREDICTED: microtubule-actin cross-linking factor 1 isoform X39 [Tribolium castaneum]|eukprot:XP_015837198.1 PREDICTED: microtubule-actin cross-linking factor 1 isoform X39 [Tribolium castaneum]
MSTQAYYKDRLGFDPREAMYDGPQEKYRRMEGGKQPHGYEENLTKFKGTIWDCFIQATSDERDAVQKKTFTKWVNKHLKKHWKYMKTYTCLHVCVTVNNSPCCPPSANRQVRDLFEDLRDGHNLISLLEVLTGEQLPREKGNMRFHMLHNIDTALHFLHCKKIKLVNIRSEDIVDGNPKLTLGLIWTIILKFQISDIVVGQEPNVSAKDYLLRWAKRTTHKYPGVHVQDFTKSWRDGLAFSAIIHRNRPDLIDWRSVKTQRASERMETAFYIAEREYGVTRLLDPEDVDTHEPDEKSLITYISSLHEVFPEPPAIHPLYDSGAQQRVYEYRELASSLHIWMREKYTLMTDRSFPNTLIEMKKIATELSRFRTDELPPRQRDKNYLSQLFRDLEKYFKTIGEVDVEPELHIDNIERNWQRLMGAYQERDRHVQDEIKRLEKLQRLAEKVHREIKQTDSGLDTIERTIGNESRRIERMHPLEAKKIADQLDQDLANAEASIQGLTTDVNTLRNGRYPQAGELDKRVKNLHERWVHLRRLLHNKIVGPLSNLSFPVEERTVTKHIRTVQETRNVDTNPHFRSLQEYIEWCKNKLKQLKKADYGNDLQSVQAERNFHQHEHKQIDQFHSKVESCAKARQYFTGEELALYNQHLGQLQKVYADLLSFSTNRMTDLDTLYDFIQSATTELQWLNEKEEVEVTRDWSDVKMNVASVETYYEQNYGSGCENLMSKLEKREDQFNSVQERGEFLIQQQNHPASKAIEAHIAAMQAQWAWIIQLSHCLETHLQNTRNYQQFFKDVQTAEEWLKEKDDVMNNEFSQGDFSLDTGEKLLQGMQLLKDELNSFGDQVQTLIARSQEIVPLKQRRQPVTRPLTVIAISNYKQNNFVIEQNKECTLTDNSGRIKWRVHNEKGIEAQVPGVCFVIPPPDKDAIDAAERLRRQYDRSIALWQKKQLRLRQNMIFATIKVVKGWDLPQFIAIGAEQRNAIRRALNEDADKIMAEGDPSDPQLRRLKREMDEVNRLFDEFEKRARAEEESKNQTRIFNQQISNLQQALDEAERIINKRVIAHLPRDIDTLQHLVLEHKEFESRLQNLEPEIEQVKDTFRSITLKTPQHKKDLEKVLDKWKYIWNTSNLYIERLKCIEIVLNGMEDATLVISEFESKLALFHELPSSEKGLEGVHEDLLKLQSAIGQQQIAMDQLNDDFDNTRRLTEKSRPNQRGPHTDIERLDKEIQKLNARWSNVCSQLADRLRGCEQAYNLLKNYKKPKENEDAWLDEHYGKLENLQPIKDRAKEHLEATRNLLNSVYERAPVIEQVNVNGGRFIREGKIWSKGLQRFREALLETQPSLDVVFRAAKESGPTGADIIAKELDEFNARYQYLIDELYRRLQEIAARCPGDIVTLRLVEQMQPRPFRTFRSEFHMSSASEQTATYTTTTHLSTQYIHQKPILTENGTTVSITTDSLNQSLDERDKISNGRPPDKYTTKTQIIHESQNWGKSMHFTEIKSLKRVHKVHEGIGTESITDTPGIVNPYNGELITVREAIAARILDGRTGKIVISPDGTQVSIEEARKRQLIDPKIAEGLISPCGIIEDGRELTLLEAIQRKIYEAEHGFVDPSEKRIKQAVEEKYKLCDETLSKLLQWIGDVEDKIASQDVIHEVEEDLRNKINTMKQIRDDLDQHSSQVAHCGDQVRQLVLTAGDVLSKSEVSTLEKNGRNLKTRYDKAVDRSERLLRKLLSAKDELTKLKGELNTFSDWLGKARRILEDKERALSDLQRLDSSADSTKEFVSDVIAHQGDLRFINMSAQKFFDESKEYLALLNDFRTSLPSRLHHIEPIAAQDSPVRTEVSLVGQQYRDLLNRANNLSDRLSGVGGRQREYSDAVDKARQWLREAEPRAIKILDEPIGGDPKAVEEQLHRAKSLNNEFVANGRLIDNAKQATDALLNSLQGQISPAEMSRLEQPVIELDQKYNQLSNALADRCQELDTALVQSQGVQDALDGIMNWLNTAESQFKTMQKPASLIKERLDEQLREHRVFQSDIDTHISSIDSVYLSASELIASSSNARVAKKIETKLNDVKARFEKLFERAQKRGEFLEEVNKGLTAFLAGASQFEQWHASIVEIIESRELAKLSIEEYAVRMQEIAANRDDKRPLFEEVIKCGKDLLNKRDTTDTANVRDRVKSMENQWRELGSLLDEKQKLSKQRAEQLNAYEALRQQVCDWLSRFEARIARLEVVAIDIEILKKQNEELKPITKEYKDYSSTIDKVNDIGTAYDNLVRGDRPESPSKRRNQVYSPTKRTYRPTQDTRSPSPSKGLSPLSPGGSSGFSSRRSSQDGFHLEELSPVQQQLSEINHRYSLLGVKINDRQSEIDSIRDEVKKHLDSLKTLSAFLDKVQRQLPKDIVPATKDEADKLNRQIKQALEEMYEKQSLLDSTKSQVKDLLRRKPGALGADNLNDELEDVVSHWKSVSDHLKNRIKFMEDMKEFHDTHDSLSSWLSAKDRMLTVLGPISSDSRMVQSQVQQVQVLREEFRTQQPQLQHLIDVGDSVLSYLDPRSPDGQKVNNKLANIQQRWADLLSKLEERADSLGAAADTSREFDAQLTRLRDALQGISDNLDELPLDKDPEEQLRKVENLERQLEGQRPLLADLEAAGSQLCDVLSDPASRADIQAKLASVGRQYNALQKKLDHKKAEIEGSLRDGRQFEASCAKTLGWLSDELGSLSEKLLISAIRDVLEQQLAHHEPIYRDVLAREHEVIMLLNKGRDMLARNNRSDSRSLQRDLDKIQQQWEKLRKETVDRQTRLQTCKEHCRKYYKVLESFLPWLRQAEDKLDTLRPSSFQRKHIEKQLKELQAFRNEVWKKSGEYENTRTLGDTFVSACDIDKEVVKNELNDLKERWDKLNNDLIERTQALEDQSRKLADFNENIRELQHGVERCEDKLASHDALGGAARDPKLLERIKALREETAKLRKPLQTVKQQAQDLASEAAQNGIDAHHLEDEVDSLGDRIDELTSKLDDRCSELQSAATAVTQFNEQVKGLSHDLTGLETELDEMKPPGRDLKTVRGQIDDIGRFLVKINKATDDVNDAIAAGERLVDSGFAPDTAQTRQQVETLRKQLGKLDDRARSREQSLEDIHKKLEQFYMSHANVLDDIHDASEQLRKLKAVGSEVDSIRAQQQDFKKFRAKTVEPVGKAVENCNRVGQGLIQSAAPGVNTAILEKDLEKMNEQWNDLKERLNDRERRLDVALLQSGKFQEALDGLAKWLTDTEELVANQKPPSADYKVVKAQLQEQKFLKKMLLDRQNSMSSLFSMGNEIAKEAEPAERKAIEKQLKNLMGRFDALTEGAQQRTLDLEQAMKVAKEFQDKLIPLQDWLDRSEKKVKDMEIIPTDEEKIQQKIREHGALHNDILGKKPDFRELTDIASNLMSLVGEDEAATLADKLQEVTDRYGNLVDASERIGQLLTDSRQGLRHLVLTYQDLAAWMDSMEHRLGRFKVLAVHTDKLLEQMDDLTALTEEIASRQQDVDSTVDAGVELMRHISSDEALQLKDKLDSLQRRYNDLTSRGADLLKHADDMLPLVKQFHNNHNRLVDWMQGAESVLQSAEPHEGDIARLELDLQELRPVLEHINLLGPQLCQNSPGEGASTIEGLVTRDNRRFDAIAEQIQRRAERIHLGKQRALEVTGDIDELLEWFREVESQIRDAEKPSAEPDLIRVQLKEHKALNDDISSQKGRVRDVLSTAKKVLRESPPSEDTSLIREKMEDLRETMDTVSALSSDRLGILEQALPLAEHFHDTHNVLSNWLSDIEEQISMLAMPAMRPDLIAQQQDRNEMFIQSINDHKPLVDKLNKTGEALIRLCNDDDGSKVQELLDSDNARYAALKLELRERQQALEQALQESSQFSDKLEGMLRALSNTADQVNNLEPISAHVPKIKDQIEDNDALISDLDKRKEAYAAVQRAADDVINKAPNRSDPAIKDIKRKLDKLKNLWDDVQKATNNRGRSLDDTLDAAQKFWKELHAIMATLKDLEDSLVSQEPPAVEPKAIQQQQVALQEIRHEIDQTKPEVDQVRASGKDLMRLCGEPDKPEVKKHIEDLDNAWDNITALYAKREENLIDAMEKAMEFHETLQNLLAFLDKAEKKFAKMGPLGTDIDAVKKQIDQLKNFKAEVDPHMVKVEALNRQAQELTERTSADQAAAIKEPLSGVNKRWDDLLRGIVERQRQLENALLRLGQFQHALNELLVWISKTDKTLDELKPVQGDPQILEIELAKLKVLVNDIQAHQTSVDTLNDAGRQIIETGEGSDEASITQDKLNTLNTQWRALMQKAADRQRELEDSLNEAQRFNAEIQDLLSWLCDVDGIITASKPVGGLPETASEQLERFMEIYNEIEDNRPKVETVLAQGQEYLRKGSNAASNLQHNLRTLKQRWDSVTSRANDKKIKLEIALKEATEFHEALENFVEWLTNAEKILSNLKPVSRVLETIQGQMEEHKIFQKDVSAHREIMLDLDKKGTHLKYFSQKQDVILIKNLLVSVQHRWERVASKSAERTRALDLGYKEAKEFHDGWSGLMTWLNETEDSLDRLLSESVGNDPEAIKSRLHKHQEFQRNLSAKQGTYDHVMKTGKVLKEKAPKSDEPTIRQMMSDLKAKWTAVCNKSVDRQRKLEEALLYSGQFKDAIAALLQWLKKVEKELSVDSPVHGDLDTVNHLVDLHNQFEKELERRNEQMESVIRTGTDLERKANRADATQIRSQLTELNELWNSVTKLTRIRSGRLDEALHEAERLHKSVHMLLDWLSEAERQLRFVGSTPEDEATAYEQLQALDRFRAELKDKEREKNHTLDLAQSVLAKAHPDAINVIKNWIKVIQSRWEEVSQWAMQRHQKLTAHMQSLRDLDECLEELIQWLLGLENTLIALKREDLPMDIPATEQLIADHKEFMENTQKRQGEVDRVCKAKQIKPTNAKEPKKFVKGKGPIRGSQHDIREPSPDSYGSLGRKQSFKGSRDLLAHRGSRSSPGRELSPDPQLPHIGPRFPSGSEPEFRSPRVKFLYDKWRHVWMLSWERQRQLYDHLAYLKEKEKADNFSWDDWRKRFLKFMNYKKSRLTDLFRKMDKDNNELIPRDDFIDGIIKTKFDTSRLEMKHVADMFDQDNRGLIDWKKFIAALRPDWEEKPADTDAQKIHDEVKRLVMLCTCRQKFRVFQVGEGKYRFGESQKLRLVRILRSTVMVRVGGGWVALDEFLIKNDPCRAKGRTNIELREQFILADGVSQTMTAFKPKTSASSPASGSSASSLRTPQGPITKVRERSARSVPMGSLPRTSKSSLSAGTPDSLSDNESSAFRTPRKPSYRSTMTPGGSRSNSRPASRTGSRPGSKPPSRHGSNLSLDSTDDGTPSRIPRRTPTSSRVPSTTSSLRRPQNGTGSRPRTPTGLISPASPAGKSSGIPRASSIPTLTSVTTPRSRIPVYKGSGDTDPESPSTSSSCSMSLSSGTKSSASRSSRSKIPIRSTSKPRQVTIGNAPTLRTAARTRTPSGSNTPVPPGQQTAASRLLRKPSGASDTPTGQAKKTTKEREPFRL